MRHTVEEKLKGTLDARLGESFRQVGERLEQAHKGLGENRVLTNVKTHAQRTLQYTITTK
jgi:DNA recombination protein RmuC